MPQNSYLLPETFPHDNYMIHLDKRLGGGLTGEVYQAQMSREGDEPLTVAIKAMRTLDFPLAQTLFLQESQTLAAMMYLEEQLNKEQKNPLKIAPIYYGRGEIDKVPYLIIEFIQGTEIPKLLRQRPLSEREAVTIGWHLYRTLDIMHTRLKKTYLDLKFENLWWVNGQLKLTDFGTLETIGSEKQGERGIKRDLLLAGVYLCAMLTKKTPKYSLGDLQEPADPIIRQTKEISWGTRLLLRRLLHRKPDARPKEAKTVSQDLQRLALYWSNSVERLLSTAERLLEQAEDTNSVEQRRQRAEFARSVLDIARIKAPDNPQISTEITRTENLLQISDYFQRAEALFAGRAYGLARKVFEEGKQWSDDPAVFRRWAYLSMVGEESFPELFDQHQTNLKQIIERMGQERWQDAKERLEPLRPLFQSSGIKALWADLTLFENMAKATQAKENGDFEQAAHYYFQANQVFASKELPDAEFIKQEEVGDLQVYGEEMRHLADTEQQSKKEIALAKKLMEELN